MPRKEGRGSRQFYLSLFLSFFKIEDLTSTMMVCGHCIGVGVFPQRVSHGDTLVGLGSGLVPGEVATLGPVPTDGPALLPVPHT